MSFVESDFSSASKLNSSDRGKSLELKKNQEREGHGSHFEVEREMADISSLQKSRHYVPIN